LYGKKFAREKIMKTEKDKTIFFFMWMSNLSCFKEEEEIKIDMGENFV
jgi:hypothetical protein